MVSRYRKLLGGEKVPVKEILHHSVKTSSKNPEFVLCKTVLCASSPQEVDMSKFGMY